MRRSSLAAFARFSWIATRPRFGEPSAVLEERLDLLEGHERDVEGDDVVNLAVELPLVAAAGAALARPTRDLAVP